MFDDDHCLVLNRFGLDLLLLIRFQVTFFFRLLAHALDGIHHIALLREERVPEIGGPLNVVCKTFHDVWQSSHCLDAWVPGLLCNSFGKLFVLQLGILRKPLLELDDFEGIGGCCQGLGQQLIWIKGYWCNKRIELVRRYFRCFLLRRFSCLFCLLRLTKKGYLPGQHQRYGTQSRGTLSHYLETRDIEMRAQMGFVPSMTAFLRPLDSFVPSPPSS